MSQPVFAAIDIGTNSIRLAVVRAEADQRLTTLSQHREVVRLGEGEFENDRMTAAAMERGALVCARFVEVARGFGANPIVALGTSAVREATNREEFIEKVRRSAGIEVRVISGVEEARLIWLGVASGIELGGRKALLIDIGGGSTEMAVGSAVGDYSMLESMKLGAIRISNRFFQGEGPISPDKLEEVCRYIQNVSTQAVRKIREAGFDIALGSAGTINALGMVMLHRGAENNGRNGIAFRTADLRETLEMLCKLPLHERRTVPGMDPQRADILPGGGAILLTLLEELGIEKITTSDRGLRDGILLDHLLREESTLQQFQSQSVRRRSILQLARACKFEEGHALHTAALALRLYDETHELGLHSYGDTSRELLEYAALVHDIGAFLSHSNHQKHAYYLVRYSDLLGFDDMEIDIIANVAYYHRKAIPKKRHENLAGLNRAQIKRVSVLAALLRIAEGLDRGHLSNVRDIRLEQMKHPDRLVLTLLCTSSCELEVWGAQNNRDLLELTFGMPLEICAEPCTPSENFHSPLAAERS